MRLRHIEVFHAVYTSGSMTNAAAVLNVSQPSISKVLSHAEQKLGYPLFERAKGKLTATPEAHRLFGQVSTIYKDIDTLRRVAANLRKADEGRIRIATTPAFGVDLLPSAIASYRQEHMDTRFEVETLHFGEMVNALLESRMDIGIAFDAEPTQGIESKILARGDFMVLVPREIDFGERKSLGLKDLEGLPFISLNKKGPLGRLLDAHIESSGFTPDTVAWSETYQVAKTMVANGIGVTIADEITAKSFPHPIVRALPLEPRLNFNICLMHFEKAPMSVLSQRFTDHLEQCLSEHLRRQI